MFEIKIIEIETKMFGDNNSAILNFSVLESRLKKKNHLINYNFVLEAVAYGMELL